MLDTALYMPRAEAVMPTLKIRLRALMREKAIRDGRDPDFDPITQEEVAKAIGATPGTLSAWARGTVSRFDKEVILKLCQYFQCGIADLLHLELDAPSPEDSN